MYHTSLALGGATSMIRRPRPTPLIYLAVADTGLGPIFIILIREVSHQHENDNNNEHVIILWIRASNS
jgi:hypothetical protein